MTLPRVSIQTEDFDVSTEIAALRHENKGVGAVCSFVGTVRDRTVVPTLGTSVSSLPSEGALAPSGGRAAQDSDAVASMELEHYPGMTEKSIEAMVDEAMRRFDIFGARIIHRVGLLQPLDQIVLVVVASAHRGDAFQACEFIMDYLKTEAPFWKKERNGESSQWVAARDSDQQAAQRWA